MENTVCFPFPFPPYAIQNNLMKEIFNCIENRNIGLFESPTGTGKSLSLICSTLHWLFLEEKRILTKLKAQQKQIQDEQVEHDDDDWLTAMSKSYDKKKKLNSISNIQSALEEYALLEKRVYEVSIRPLQDMKSIKKLNQSIFSSTSRYSSSNKPKAVVASSSSKPHVIDSDDEFEIVANGSDHEEGSESEEENAECHRKESKIDILELPQIIYSSRTHSQIAQFMNEIKKTAFKDKVRCVVVGSRKTMCINQEVNNKSTTGQHSDARLSEVCLEMAKHKSKKNDAADSSKRSTSSGKKRSSHTSCSYHQSSVEKLCSDYTLASLHDIEEVVSLGEQLHACPYYATRTAIHSSNSPHMICLPYNNLVHSDIRNSLGIQIHSNTVVVIDEAHNLVDSITNIHSTLVYQKHFELASTALNAYLKRFRYQLKPKTVYHINLLNTVISSLKEYLKPVSTSVNINATYESSAHSDATSNTNNNVDTNPQIEVLNPNDLMFRVKCDNINLIQLLKYLKSVDVINKIGGFAENIHRKEFFAQYGMDLKEATPLALKHKDAVHQNDAPPTYTPVNYIASIRTLLDFLLKLLNADEHCKLIVQHSLTESSHVLGCGNNTSSNIHSHKPASITPYYSFVLLNPAIYFEELLLKARSVILVGGTLQPFSLMTQQLIAPDALFPSEEIEKEDTGEKEKKKRVVTYACDHIIPNDNILTITLSHSALNTTREFNFTHNVIQNQVQSAQLLNDLYDTVYKLAGVVPYGLIIFFTSYQYMDKVLAHWNAKTKHYMNSKYIYAEQRNQSENVFDNYAKHAISSVKGALLCCVMGGKMSEGINFSDNLARCVIVVGMPYPNKNDIVLQEKLKFIDHQSNAISRSTPVPTGARTGNSNNAIPHHISSQEAYQNICMSSINQSIGRSIRHIRDYASIVLIDSRFQYVTSKLPKWTVHNNRLKKYTHCNECLDDLSNFYASHQIAK